MIAKLIDITHVIMIDIRYVFLVQYIDFTYHSQLYIDKSLNKYLVIMQFKKSNNDKNKIYKTK